MRYMFRIVLVILLFTLGARAQELPVVEAFGGYSYFRAGAGDNLQGWNVSLTGNVNQWFGITASFSGHYGTQGPDFSGNFSVAVGISEQTQVTVPGRPFPGDPGSVDIDPRIAPYLNLYPPPGGPFFDPFAFGVVVPQFLRPNADADEHTFLFGPRFTFYRGRRWTPFVHTLFGVTRTHLEIPEAVFLFPPVPFLSPEPFPSPLPVPRPTTTVTVTVPPLNVSNTAFALGLGGGVDVAINRSLALRALQVDYIAAFPENATKNNLRVSAGLVWRFGVR